VSPVSIVNWRRRPDYKFTACVEVQRILTCFPFGGPSPWHLKAYCYTYQRHETTCCPNRH